MVNWEMQGKVAEMGNGNSLGNLRQKWVMASNSLGNLEGKFKEQKQSGGKI